MADISFEDAVERSVEMDPRYTAGAYDFVRDALHIAVKKYCNGDEARHVSGQELLEAVREFALKEYGPMAFTLLKLWGINRGIDVGYIVYNLIEVKYFGKSEGDSIDDFDGGYEFEPAFTMPYLPRRMQVPVINRRAA
jgi:uncharacterized repeat protein (TIGR04138 family)